MPLAVPREHRMMWGKSRYASPVYGQHFIAAIDLMARPEIALIRATTGWRFSKIHKQPSTIIPTPKLDDIFRLAR